MIGIEEKSKNVILLIPLSTASFIACLMVAMLNAGLNLESDYGWGLEQTIKHGGALAKDTNQEDYSELIRRSNLPGF